MKDVIKFETVKEAAEWLNKKDVYRQNIQNLEEILSNYDLEVEGMSSIRYKSDGEELWFAFFKIENGKVVDFENIELGFRAFPFDYEDVLSMVDEDFESIVEKFYSYLDGRPLKEGENVLRVFENWAATNEYDKKYDSDLDDLVRYYEYYVLIKEVDDIAKDVKNVVGARYELRVKNKIIRNLIF